LLVSLYDVSGKILSRASYWPKQMLKIIDTNWPNSFRQEYLCRRTKPDYSYGPWVNDLAAAKTKIELLVSKPQKIKDNLFAFDCEVKNTGNVPSLYTNVQVTNSDINMVCDRNYFVLLPGETMPVRAQVLTGKSPFFPKADTINPDKVEFTASSWNTQSVNGISK
jgi:hypothetical protein